MGEVIGYDFLKKEEKYRFPPRPVAYTWQCDYCRVAYRYEERKDRNIRRITIELSRYNIDLCEHCIEKIYETMKED